MEVIVIIEGKAGSGKTTLMNELGRHLLSLGINVECYEGEQFGVNEPVPIKPNKQNIPVFKNRKVIIKTDNS